MKLKQLLEGLPTPPVALIGDPSVVEINGIAYNSRKVALGWLFVAVRGMHIDGHRFIGGALRLGALAIVGEDPAPADLPKGTVYAQVDDARRDLAWLADAFYDRSRRWLRSPRRLSRRHHRGQDFRQSRQRP